MSQSTSYKNKYIAANYDRINLTVPKGMKPRIEAYAKAEGKSVNGLINELLRQALGEESQPARAAASPDSKSVREEPRRQQSKKDMDIFLF